MNPIDKAHKLGEIVRQQLYPLINNDYILIDLPYHSNIGDILIWAGEEKLLKEVPYKCLYQCSCESFEYQKIDSNVIILFSGGGNWGDLYSEHQEFRLKIINLYPDNPIIQLPQTVYYKNVRNAASDAYLMSKHKDFTIFARDEYSFNFLKRFGYSKKIIMTPDMAFVTDIDDYRKYFMPELNKVLFVKRKDAEIDTGIDYAKIVEEKDVVISDWPTFETMDKTVQQIHHLVYEFKKFRNTDCYDYARNQLMPSLMKIGVNFVSPYNPIYTTRLHVAILSIILGKKVFIIDNSYGKNSHFFKTWLNGVDNVKCLNSYNDSYKIKLNRAFDYLLAFYDLYKMRIGLRTRIRLLFQK